MIISVQSLVKHVYNKSIGYDLRLIPYGNIKTSVVSQNLYTTKQKKLVKTNLPMIHQPPPGSVVLRALLLFYPADQEDTFASEFRWFYRSWVEMMTFEPASWRTDLIVFTNKNVQMFKDLDCLYDQVRLNSDEKPKCRIFSYTRVKDRNNNHEPSSKYQTIDKNTAKLVFEQLKSYGYIDSINSVFEYYPSFSIYNYILRTDMDCFLTNNFALYVPYNTTLLVGHGGYSTEFNSKRLKRIAHDMNWQYANINSLGSTW